MSNSWQLGALMKKNWILMKRSCCTTCCEIFFPIFLMIMLVLVRRAVKNETYLEPTEMTPFYQTNSSAIIDPSMMLSFKTDSKSDWNGFSLRDPL